MIELGVERRAVILPYDVYEQLIAEQKKSKVFGADS